MSTGSARGYTVKPVSGERFTAFYASYDAVRAFPLDGYAEVLADFRENYCFFVLRGGAIAGGFTFSASAADRAIGSVFCAPGFTDRKGFWQALLRLADKESQDGRVRVRGVSLEDATYLAAVMGARIVQMQRIMFRPTEFLGESIAPSAKSASASGSGLDARIAGADRLDAQDGQIGFPLDEIELTTPDASDIDAIVDAAYEAHCAGYVGTVQAIDRAEIDAAIRRRYDLFGQTGTLDYSSIARVKESGLLVGACIAGVYPDSSHHIATIHQLCVRPVYRKRGIASAMMRRSIAIAQENGSPIITLTVMEKNPAQALYRAHGFAAGAVYVELEIM